MASKISELGNEANPQSGAQPSAPSSETRPPAGTSVWSRPNFRLAMLVVGIVVVVAAIGLYWYLGGRESTDDAQVDGHLNPISAKISGNILNVLINDNQPVKAGQVLVEIDPRDLKARVDQLSAALDLATAQASAANVNIPLTAEVTESGATAAAADYQNALADQAAAAQSYQMATTSDLAYARAQLAKQQAAAAKAQSDLERMRPLAAKAEISQQEFDGYIAAAAEAQGDLDSAKQRVSQSEQNVAIAKSKLEGANARVAQAQAGITQAKANLKQVNVRAANARAAGAAIAQAKANLEAAKLELSYTTIVAPVDGVVTNKSVEVGQVVGPGQGLLILVPLNDIWVTANFKETQLAGVRPGQPARVQVDMYGQTFTGRVDSVAGATGSRLSLLPPENATGNFVKVVQRIPVKIVLDPIPPDKAILRPGMNVNATIITR